MANLQPKHPGSSNSVYLQRPLWKALDELAEKYGHNRSTIIEHILLSDVDVLAKYHEVCERHKLGKESENE